jgi:glycosyltransferase involved in cell wall biosynthesis
MSGTTSNDPRTSEARRPTVSVVVPARNAARHLPALLEALAGQTAQPGSFEVVVVDDGSSDGGAEIVRRSKAARVVDAGAHVGVYAARNLGLAAARGSVLAFVDADCVPAADWVERGLHALETSGADLLAGKIEPPADARLSTAALIDLTHSYDQERYASEGHFACGNFWVRRTVFDRVGPFKADLRSGGDTEFGERATRAGVALAYAPDVRVMHRPVSRMRNLARRSFRIGFGDAQRGRPQIARRLASRTPYVSSSGMAERLEQLGRPVGRRELAAMYLAKNLLVRLPILAGNIAGLIAAKSHTGRKP